MKKKFRCKRCKTLVVVEKTNPKKREFVWTEAKMNKKNSYCYECDDKLIQGIM